MITQIIHKMCIICLYRVLKHINTIFTRDSGEILFQATMHIHSIGDRYIKCIALVVLLDDKYYDANGIKKN